MPLPFGALAGRIPAGDVSLDQRAAQGFSDRRKLLGQTLPALAQSQFRKPFEPNACFHLSASIHQNALFSASANFQTCEFPPTSLIRREIELACEVPVQKSEVNDRAVKATRPKIGFHRPGRIPGRPPRLRSIPARAVAILRRGTASADGEPVGGAYGSSIAGCRFSTSSAAGYLLTVPSKPECQGKQRDSK